MREHSSCRWRNDLWIPGLQAVPPADPDLNPEENKVRIIAAGLARQFPWLSYRYVVNQIVLQLTPEERTRAAADLSTLRISIMNTVGPSPRQQQDQEALMADLHDDPPVPQGVNPNMEEDDPMGTVEWINPTTGLPRVSTWRIFDVEITKPMRQTIVQGIPTRFTIILPTGPIFPQSKRKMPFPEGSVQQTAMQAENPELCWIQLQAGWWQLFHWTTPVEETPVPLPPKEA